VLLVVCAAVLGSLALRTPFKVDVVRDRGSIARMVGPGLIENVYRLQIMNATEQIQTYRLRVVGLERLHIASDDQVELGPASARWIPLRLQLPPGVAEPGSHPIWLRIEESKPDGIEVIEKAVFLVPR
jgi:polyferredoxin